MRYLLTVAAVCAASMLFTACAFNFDLKGDFAALGYKRKPTAGQAVTPATTAPEDTETKKEVLP